MELKKRSYAILGQLFSLVVLFLANAQAYGDFSTFHNNYYADAPTFLNSYIVTARKQTDLNNNDVLEVLPDGKMFFCSAVGHYVQQDATYLLADDTSCAADDLDAGDSSAIPPMSFMDKLEVDVRKTVTGKTAHLILYVHGLGVSFQDAVLGAAQFGLHFQGENVNNSATDTTTCLDSGGGLPQDCILCPQNARKGLSPGLLVAFDWPSYPLFGPPAEELLLLQALLAPVTGKEIRTRADESAEALANIFEYVVQELQSRLRSDGIRLNSTLIAHSEGNYMVMKGAQAAVDRKMKNVFNNVFLLAADISSAALSKGQPGEYLPRIGKEISVYSSTSDPDLLVSSYLWSSLHNPEFKARLGQAGPYARRGTIKGIDATKATNRISPAIGDLTVEEFDDCAVPNPVSSLQSPVLAGLLAQHGSYRCVAEILDDMNLTMMKRVQRIPGANRRIKVPGIPGRFALQTDDNPPLFSCKAWKDAGFGGDSTTWTKSP